MATENFLLSTDYPFDKVLETYEGSFVAAARYSLFSSRVTTSTFPHGIGDWGLITGSFSTDNVNWLPFGMVNADVSSGTPTFQTIEVTAYCTTGAITVVAANYLGSAATIHYALQLMGRD